ncbi:P-loop containing nucleoside triphosphate hydrolase [Parasponia andersonii]|uniref:P-loop containing nucleoside triphosphate hydrolase n=1 Tax=Parasponia andersonii TaxID=3476 RepID=A0A2P5DZ57_PARAD|nr:P-loop containing nucleoside triphosphate hydrolase [Parasponia andersonii]
MGPLLETFFNYFKDERGDSPLRRLWRRISEEMQQCVQCITQHHQAQEMYSMEYELSSISPLLDVLRSLDEERVTTHLKEINSRLVREDYDPAHNNFEVVSAMYEVLMFPVLLDDQSLFTEFEQFIEAIDNIHELALDGQQQFPGVYALFFFKRRVRSVGHRLAGSMGKLRRATVLEPLQPLIKKFIGFLETEALPSAMKTSRPRAELDRVSIWLGIKSLLGFLEPPAFEEGILERYPIILDIVLNHSLEALQDGEHGKQRRHFLYFLLHQVPVSSNFSVLTRQKARQIALLIVHRCYAMDPPCPPFECAHMWGPPLVSSLKDSSLHNSLRQPAFDLIQTILVSDAAVLISSLLSSFPPPSPGRSISNELNDDEDDVRLLFAVDAEEKNDSSWRDFGMQSKIASLDFGEWMCIPMLWIDVLVDINPLVLPVSFWKAVFWARSRFSMVEPETNSEMTIPVRAWLLSSEISSTFGWRLPTGSDDGGDEKDQKNSIKVSTMSLALIRAFTRLTAHFLVQVGQAELRKQWTWEPRMGESLILSLLDPSDTVRQFGKCILEHVSDTRGLACGLKFLCSSGSSLSSVVLGLRHAVKLVQVDIVVLKFQMLQHFFFILRKLLEQGELPTPDMPEKSSDFTGISKFSTHGGFLRQPVFDSLTVSMDGKSVEINKKLQEKFCCLLSETAWPCIRRCLIEGKASIDSSICQMTCIRLLEILPIVFEKFGPSFVKQPDSCEILKSAFDFSWLHDLVDWGKSALKVVVVYWKRAVGSLLKLFKGSCHKTVVLTIKTIEDLISCDNVSMDELTEQVSHLSVSLSKEASDNIKRNFSSESLPLKMKEPILEVQPWPIKDSEVQILDPATINDKKDRNDLIVLSDDEKEVSPSEIMLSDTGISRCKLDSKTVASRVDENTSIIGLTSKKVYGVDTSKDMLKATLPADVTDGFASMLNSDKPSKKLESVAFPKSGVDNNQKERISELDTIDSLKSQGRVDLKKSSDVAVGYKKSNKACESVKTNDMVLKDIVCDAEDDPLESALNSVGRQSSSLAKPNIFVPKRQLIQLRTPVGDKSGNFQRLEARVRRFKPPRLDEWYKPILEIDYFATTGLTSACEDNRCTFGKLKEVPVSFESPEEYIDIFRPLILEEFKAQLQSSFQENPSWEEMYFGVVSVLAVERVDDFHLVRFAHDDDDSTSSRSFSENDLVLLTKEPLQKSSHDVHMVGKVERRERDNKRRLIILLIRFYLQNGTSRLNQARKNLLERSKWHASRIMSITSQLREFQALSSIKEIPLFPIILKPINDGPCSKDFSKVDLSKLSQPLQLILKSSFNESQLQAISVAIGLRSPKKKVELSLIQGPPGTGKTQTILAIASGLLACPLEKKEKTENPLAGTGSLKKSNSLLTKIRETAAIARAWQDAALAKQLNEDVQRTSKSTDATVKRRVLICAQSNAAVDELVSRISSQGLYRIDGKMYKPYLVRVGNVKTVHPNSLPFFIDTLVDHRLADETMKLSESKNDVNVHSSTTLRSNLEKLVDRIRFYEAKRANLSDENSNLKNSLEDDSHKEDDLKELSDAKVQMKLRKLYEQKKQIYKDLSIAQAQEKKTNEEIKGLKYKIRKSILREAEIVVTTLSGCGGDLYAVCSESVSGHRFGSPSENTLFDAVVIDEAAQAVEPATLIPLQLLKSNGVKCIMVGDPKQLPATVLSNVASKFLFECSMFERLQKAGHPVVMLTEQYRMHPEICRFPSSHFYERKLLNGKMSSKLAPFHETEGLGPYVFYDIIDGRELRGKNSGALSLYNEHEVDAALEVVKFFKNKYPSEFIAGRIGIITPYKRQLSLLRSRFSTFFGSSIVDDIEFNTVDGFQGREVDILILSTVRAATSSAGPGINLSNIGFVADVRRMNVALTRAKLSLLVVGNARTLQTNKNWAALIKDAVERNLVRTVKMPYRSMFKGSLQKNCSSENFDNNLTELKCDEKVKDASQHVKQNESSKRIGKIRTNYINQGAKSRDDGREKDSSATRDDVGISKTSGRDGLLPVDSSSVVVANVDYKFSEDGKFVTRGKHVTYGEFKGKESGGKEIKENSHKVKRKSKLENSGKSMYHPEEDTGDKGLKEQMPKRLKTFSGGDGRKQGNQDASALSAATASSQKGRDLNDQGRDPNKVGTSDLIAKRKKQREAVDAILYSALIPSKKSETSAKPLPAKRHSSSSSTPSIGIKQPKTRRD